jgi:hypothetical protein
MGILTFLLLLALWVFFVLDKFQTYRALKAGTAKEKNFIQRWIWETFRENFYMGVNLFLLFIITLIGFGIYEMAGKVEWPMSAFYGISAAWYAYIVFRNKKVLSKA